MRTNARSFSSVMSQGPECPPTLLRELETHIVSTHHYDYRLHVPRNEMAYRLVVIAIFLMYGRRVGAKGHPAAARCIKTLSKNPWRWSLRIVRKDTLAQNATRFLGQPLQPIVVS